MENHSSVKSEDDCGSSLRLSHGRISFVWGKPGVWRSFVFGCLSVIARFLGVCQLSVTCWSSVHRLTVVCPLPVACLSGVVRLSVNCRSVDCSRPFVNCCWPFLRVRVGNLSAVNWPTVSLVELFFNLPTNSYSLLHPPLHGSIIGTPFYVMEYAQGRLFKDPSLPGMSMEERKVCKSYIFWVVFESAQRTKATWLLVVRVLPLGKRETLKYWLARKKNKYERVEREPMFSRMEKITYSCRLRNEGWSILS